MLIVTIACQRSGTKAFASLFSTGTEITTFGELFNPDVSGPLSYRGFIASEGYDSLLRQGADVALDNFFRHFYSHRNKIHFDVMFNQLEFTCISWNSFYRPFFYGYLRSRKATIILLTRNPLDSFKSSLLLRTTGIAHTRPGDNPPSRDRKTHAVSATSRQFADYAANIQRHYSIARDHLSDYPYFCEVSYEEFARLQSLPQRVLDTIRACAVAHGLPLDVSKIQEGPPPLARSASSQLEINDNLLRG